VFCQDVIGWGHDISFWKKRMKHGRGRDMDDEWVVGGSALCREYFFGCQRVAGERAEAIDSFCGEYDDVSVAEMGSREVESTEGLGGGYV
jgi:hypothetical protein